MESSHPYKEQIFVCINERASGEKSSCKGIFLINALKDKIKETGIQGVRVSKSHCMDLCEKGPNVFMSSTGTCFHHVRIEDVSEIIAQIKMV